MKPRLLWPLFSLMLLGAVILAACTPKTTTPSPTAVSSQAAATSLPTAQPTETLPAEPLKAVLLAGPGSDPVLAGSLQTALNEIMVEAGLVWQVRQQLLPEDLGTELRLVVALPPDPGLAALAASAPQTQFLAVGVPGLAPAPNLSVIGAQGTRPDQQGFMAGYIASMVTSPWRVGVISISDSPAGRAARSGFLNGAVFFYGLCNQVYLPNCDFPRYFELPAGAATEEWQAAAGYMIHYGVSTVFVAPGAGDEAMLSTLGAAGINLLGSGAPPASVQANWVVSLDYDLLAQVQSLVPHILAGQGGQDVPLALGFTYTNSELFSPGKQTLASSVLVELQASYIDPGVDLTTGENRE